MTILDHALAAALVIVWPVLGTRAYRRFVRAVATEGSTARLRQYWSTLAEEWSLVAAALLLWFIAGRTPAALGLTLGPASRRLIGFALTAAVLGLLVAQGRALRNLTPASRARIRAQLGEAIPLLPVTDHEYRVFQGLALSAGICEEILFRGFLIWYAGTFVGPWLGLVATSVVFGLGHAYQGRSGMLKTGAVGLVMGGFYLATGSLLGPMIVHAAIDLQGGMVGRAALAAPPADLTPA